MATTTKKPATRKTTTSKPAAKPAAKTSAKTTNKTATLASTLPERELKTWLQGRTNWNHDEWLGLLSDLDRKGYGHLISNPNSLTEIGRYLETHRR